MRAEFRRQLKRRRTTWALSAMVLLPVLIAVILQLLGPASTGSGTPELSDLATGSGVNFALFSVSVMASLLLPVIVALFAGDIVASEASWGSLRYLLLRPVGRSRLLWTKLGVAATFGLAAAVLLVITSIVAGLVFFGGGGLSTPLGSSLATGESLRILGITAAYVVTQQCVAVALAFLLGVLTDAPLGAVGGAVLTLIVSSVLDAISSLGALRYGLPTHYAFAWFGLLDSPQQTSDMVRGLVVQLPWTILPLVLAWRRFARKDILS